MVKGAKRVERFRRNRSTSKKNKEIKKKLGNNGTRVTRTAGLKSHVRRLSAFRVGNRHMCQYPSNRSAPQAPKAMRKRARKYKREQQALMNSRMANRDRNLKQTALSLPKIPSACTFDHTRPSSDVVAHFFETAGGQECLRRNWSQLSVDLKCGVTDSLIRCGCWDSSIVETIIADELFVSQLDMSLLRHLVDGIGIHLGDLLNQSDDLCCIWRILKLNDDTLCSMLVKRIIACRSDIVVKCRWSFEIMTFVVKRMAGNDESRFCGLMRDLVAEVGPKMMLFRNGCFFLGALASSHPEMCENSFASVSMEARMDQILRHEYQPCAIIPLLSASGATRAMNFVSRIVINAVGSIDGESLSSYGKQVLAGVVAHTRLNRSGVFVSDEALEKAEVMCFVS